MNNIVKKVIVSYHDLQKIIKLKKHIKLKKNLSNDVFVIDGFLCELSISLFYILVLYHISLGSLKRPAKILLLIKSKKHKIFKATWVYRLFYKTEYIALDDFLNSYEETMVKDQSQFLIKSLKNPSDLFQLNINGYNFGRDIYYSYIRNELIGTVSSVNDPKIHKEIYIGIRNSYIAKKIIKENKVKNIILSDNCYTTFSPFFHIPLLSNIPVTLCVPFIKGSAVLARQYTSYFNYESESRRYVFSFDKKTENAAKSIVSDQFISKAEIFFKKRIEGVSTIFNGSYHESTIKYRKSELQNRIGLNNHHHSVLVATHLLWDDPAYESLYMDYEIWFRESFKIMLVNTSVNWIIKVHPSEYHMDIKRSVMDIIDEELRDKSLPPHIVLIKPDTTLNTYSLIDYCDAVLTVRGTIAFEAASMGCYVITAGFGPHSELNFCKEFDTVVNYERFLSDIQNQDLTITNDNAKKAMLYLYIYMVVKSPKSHLVKDLFDDALFSIGEADKRDSVSNMALMINENIAGDLIEW